MPLAVQCLWGTQYREHLLPSMRQDGASSDKESQREAGNYRVWPPLQLSMVQQGCERCRAPRLPPSPVEKNAWHRQAQVAARVCRVLESTGPK